MEGNRSTFGESSCGLWWLFRRAISIAASVAILLSVGVYYWKDSEKDPSLSLALLEDDVFSLTGNEVVLIENEKPDTVGRRIVYPV